MTTKKNKGPTDFNDLHVVGGLDAVRKQLQPLVDAAKLPRAPSVEGCPHEDAISTSNLPPEPPLLGEVQDLTLGDAKKRFALISGTTKVWDSHLLKPLKTAEAKAEMGADVFKDWMAASDKRKVKEQDVMHATAKALAAQKGGGGVGDILERFTYLAVSDECWDSKARMPVRINDIRHAYPDAFDLWYKHPDRRSIEKQNLVFDPTQRVDPETHINMFRGLPLVPEGEPEKCESIRAMMLALCNNDVFVWEWLADWLAYPLQHVGAKMATAVLMHSTVHGSGKSLLFDGVMRPIYGEYGATLGQQQMESSYNDWMSNKLYCLFEEIFSRSSKYSHNGSLKQMITGDKFRIEKKFVSGWEEANHANCIFLSNEIQPFPVEPSDRRFLVIWPDWKLDAELQASVESELSNGGVAAFYSWLLGRDLGRFGPHTKPPMTDAKQRLVNFGRPSWDVFVEAWENGETDAPFHSCLSTDLYDVYVRWCAAWRMNVVDHNKFSELVGTKVKKKSRVPYDRPAGAGRHAKKDVQGTFFVLHEDSKPANKTQKDWLSECVQNFRLVVAESGPVQDVS